MRSSLLSGFVLFSFLASFANNANYEQRRQAYIDSALAHFSKDAITLQAYRGVPVDTGALNDLLTEIPQGTTVDFGIVKLIRVLYFSNGAYDSLILPVLMNEKYWLHKDETRRTYWSENHMIMWMSSDWLLHQKYNKPIDSTLERRLRHYLHMKVDYGYYEFFSSVYLPYTLSGLLNLADFAQDTEIKTLAAQAAQRLLGDILMLTNNKGTFYPVAGRNYYGKYTENPYGQNHNNLIYLVSGMGQPPYNASHAGGFLASSTLEIDSVANSWKADLDTVYHIGHTLDTGFILNAAMSHIDKMMFQWSSGAYFHPSVAFETAKLLTDSNMWDHVDFEPVSGFRFVTLSSVVNFANTLSCISKSSVISGQDAVIYKHGSVTLASLRDFWKGKIGFQQIPVVANVGTTAVLTASGEVYEDWPSRPETSDNSHLPYVAQKKNLALIMYRPEFTPSIVGYPHKEVALYFRESDYDEVVNDSLWLLGRQGTNFVAVRRNCIGQINNVKACNLVDGQSWVLMVGDTALYGSFSNFQNIVHQSQFEEKWSYDSVNLKSIYYAKIVMDTTTIEYAWERDSSNVSGVTELTSENSLPVFPNPATSNITLDLSGFAGEDVVVEAFSILGEKIYAAKSRTISNASISTGNWNDGVYFIIASSKTLRLSQKVIIRK